MNELVILVGLQASGKTSFYRSHLAATHVHVSKDLMRNNRSPARRQVQLIAEALAAGRVGPLRLTTRMPRLRYGGDWSNSGVRMVTSCDRVHPVF